jgi:hypothetical protein
MPPTNQIVGQALVPAKTLALTATTVDRRCERNFVRKFVSFRPSIRAILDWSLWLMKRPKILAARPLSNSYRNLNGNHVNKFGLQRLSERHGIVKLADHLSRRLSTSTTCQQKLSEAVSTEILSAGPGVPTTRVTQLANGFRIATETSPGHFNAVGVYIDAGTRFESELTAGVSHILDRIAFKVLCFSLH